jgi:hypothetical protein
MCVHPIESGDREWMTSVCLPMLALEKELMTLVDAIRAEGDAVIREIEAAYDFKFDRVRTEDIARAISDADWNLGLYDAATPRQGAGMKR